ncbi:hypothetical protein GCM10023092_21580 [Rurimicrobium arvi]|uniref:Uncharacterized protein n=1 Tax=Rurimicrobium arvi TaxID=2049916 RepID=A0ABP8MYP8_9BACT
MDTTSWTMLNTEQIPSRGGVGGGSKKNEENGVAKKIASTRNGDCAQCKNLLATIPNPNVSR